MADEKGQPLEFKGQPWILFDTIVARSYLLGDVSAQGIAIGGQVPAISAAGEMTFFNGGGRVKSTLPWYTNLDLPGQLSYGLEVWQIYLMFAFPTLTPNQNNGADFSVNPGIAPGVKLMEAILNFGVLSIDLGQENQVEWPLTRFGAGGGMSLSNTIGMLASNSIPENANVMKLPEPIMMPRTQNLNARIRIAPEGTAMIGTVAAPGVGSPLLGYSYAISNGEVTNTVVLPQLPWSVQLGLVGKRVKKTQYGQVNPQG